jgi:recombination protein RecR
MFEYAQPLHDLIEELRHIPGIGAKTAQRIAFYFLGLPTEDADRLAEAIREAKRKIFYCARCNNITHVDPCICADDRRGRPLGRRGPFNISHQRTGPSGSLSCALGSLAPQGRTS